MVDIFNTPEKTTVNRSMQSKSIMVVGRSKSGKSTLASQAPRPVFLCTENGTEALTGFTPIPIASWTDFKSAVNQLCTPKGRERFDTVVIDTYTNLILLLDKYAGQKITTDKTSYDFGSDADYGRGTKTMKNELGLQLQRLQNQGYLLMNIVHAEDKADFKTGTTYIGTSLPNSLYGVAEKFVDEIVYLRRDINAQGEKQYTMWFNEKGGFAGAGGRFTPQSVDYLPTSYANLEKAITMAIDESGATISDTNSPSFKIENEGPDFESLMLTFNTYVKQLMTADENNGVHIQHTIEKILGPGKKVSDMVVTQAELLEEIVNKIKTEFSL